MHVERKATQQNLPQSNLKFSEKLKFTLPSRHYFICKFKRLYNPKVKMLYSLLIVSSLFWNFTQHRLVVIDRRFGTIYRSHLQGSSSLLTLENGTDRLSRNVGNYQSTLRKIAEELTSHLCRGGSLKSRTASRYFYVFDFTAFKLWPYINFTLKMCRLYRIYKGARST